MPPVKPLITSLTPSSFSVSASVHQKQPPEYVKVSAVAAVDPMLENKKRAAAAKMMFFMSVLSHLLSVQISVSDLMP